AHGLRYDRAPGRTRDASLQRCPDEAPLQHRAGGPGHDSDHRPTRRATADAAAGSQGVRDGVCGEVPARRALRGRLGQARGALAPRAEPDRGGLVRASPGSRGATVSGSALPTAAVLHEAGENLTSDQASDIMAFVRRGGGLAATRGERLRTAIMLGRPRTCVPGLLAFALGFSYTGAAPSARMALGAALAL